MMKIAIIGASGFSREVADICFALHYEDIVLIDYIAHQADCFGIPLYSENAIDRFVEKKYNFIIKENTTHFIGNFTWSFHPIVILFYPVSQ